MMIADYNKTFMYIQIQREREREREGKENKRNIHKLVLINYDINKKEERQYAFLLYTITIIHIKYTYMDNNLLAFSISILKRLLFNVLLVLLLDSVDADTGGGCTGA
jgi:hypothetical protein